MTMTRTHTQTYVLVHAWAETDILGKDEHPGMKGMPRDGDACAFPECHEMLRAGERAVAVIEVRREQRIRPERGEAWLAMRGHGKHRTWRDGAPGHEE